LDFIGFHNLTAQWLVDNRKIKGIGTDARSFDIGPSETLPAHQILLGNNIWALESVANINKLPVKGATVYVMPMKIEGGSGGPTRIIAQTDPAGRSSRQTTIIGVVLMLTILSMTVFI
jgi:kynurenine formamidase